MKEIYEILKEIRLKQNKSRKQVELLSGVNQYVLDKIEKGIIRLTVENFIKLCKAYNIDPKIFFDENSTNTKIKENLTTIKAQLISCLNQINDLENKIENNNQVKNEILNNEYQY